jgi:TolA-binding protein
VTRLALSLVLLLAAALPAEPAPPATPEPGVVQVDAPAPGDADWQKVEDARGGTGLAQALQGYLAAHPHGLGASRALQEQAAAQDDLGLAASMLERARVEGAGNQAGSAAALSEARLQYDMGDPAEALRVLDASQSWPRPAADEDEWLYWRAQCRLLGKGYAGARVDLRSLLRNFPASPRAEAALAARAECDFVLKDFGQAEEAWQRLSGDAGPFVAQALWGLALLRQRQGRMPEAQALFQRLIDRFPASFEARAAAAHLDALAAAAGKTVPIRPRPAPAAQLRAPARLWVQVGAYARRAAARQECARLAAHHWRAQVSARVGDGHRLYLVRLGPFRDNAQAQSTAKRLAQRERLDPRVVEE